MAPFYAQEHDYSSFNVLAVDDIPINLILVQKMLSRFNFTLRTAGGGQQAPGDPAEHGGHAGAPQQRPQLPPCEGGVPSLTHGPAPPGPCC